MAEAKKVVMTYDGLKKMEQELENLKTVRRKEVAEKIKTQPIPKLIWALSAPAVLSLLLNALNTAIDGIFVAKSAGITALSAVTVSFGVILIIQALSLLIAAGASVEAIGLPSNNV